MFKILLYHSVSKIDQRDNLGIRIGKEDFYRQMSFLKSERYTILPLREAIDCLRKGNKLPHGALSLTFDDGYRDNVTDALPVLEDMSFKATFFVSLGYINGVKTDPYREWQRWECMDWDDLRCLADKGYDIGSHGCHHIDLCKFTRDARDEELTVSKRKIKERLNKDIVLFSYPYGSFDSELVCAAREAGYEAACTTSPGANGYDTDLFKLHRTEITAKDNLDDFKHKLEDE